MASAKYNGYEEGIEKGLNDAKIKMVTNMLKKGIDVETIKEVTDLSIEEIQNLKENISK